ncbi:hypothetical protein PSPO01_15143 [Paraphaeosphaeria sporulosa]
MRVSFLVPLAVAATAAARSAPWTPTSKCEYPDNKYMGAVINNLSNGTSPYFFDKVADDVDWRICGTHPMAGSYHSKEIVFTNSMQRLINVLTGGIDTKVLNLFGGCDEPWSTVLLDIRSTLQNGDPFMMWNTLHIRWSEEGYIVQILAFPDASLVTRAITSNEIWTNGTTWHERDQLLPGPNPPRLPPGPEDPPSRASSQQVMGGGKRMYDQFI